MKWYSNDQNDKFRYYIAINKTWIQKYTTLFGVSSVERNVSSVSEWDIFTIQGSILNKVGEFHNTLKS